SCLTSPPPKPEAYTLPKVTEEILRNILLQYASENCCQSSQFIRDLQLLRLRLHWPGITASRPYLEARYTCWTFEPFDNQKSRRSRERPATSALGGWLSGCQRCKGRRYLRCGECSGQGKRTVLQGTVARRVACSGCDGQGKRSEAVECPGCRGHGEIECPTCRGRSACFLREAEVPRWRRRDADFIEEKTDLPDELAGEGRVSPIQNFPYASVNEASAKLLQEAERSYRGAAARSFGREDLHKQLGSQANSLVLFGRMGDPAPETCGGRTTAAPARRPPFEPLVLVDLAVRAKTRRPQLVRTGFRMRSLAGVGEGPGSSLGPAAFEKHLTIRVGAKDEAGQAASAEHENSGADFRVGAVKKASWLAISVQGSRMYLPALQVQSQSDSLRTRACCVVHNLAEVQPVSSAYSLLDSTLTQQQAHGYQIVRRVASNRWLKLMSNSRFGPGASEHTVSCQVFLMDSTDRLCTRHTISSEKFSNRSAKDIHESESSSLAISEEPSLHGPRQAPRRWPAGLRTRTKRCRRRGSPRCWAICTRSWKRSGSAATQWVPVT
uniref:CR-type domain-containing protein n=1 Tax=Macrostomum lignano TaxID=282301 RepID=A0A1I8F6M7_9PLAT